MKEGEFLMRKETFLENIDGNEIEQLVAEVRTNSDYFKDISGKLIREYAGDLDDLMRDLMNELTQPDPMPTDLLERYYAELTNMVYFMCDRLEQLSAYNDLSKAAAKEVYNKAYLEASSQKDEKGKSRTTIAENTAIAENNSQYNNVVSSVYEHVYKTLKLKYDCANEMITTLKNIIKRRMQGEYLATSVPSNVKVQFGKFTEDVD